jgi:hypothetical protein
MEPEVSLPFSQQPSKGPYLSQIHLGPRPFVTFRNTLIFYGEELLAPLPTPKLDDRPLSAVSYCLFNIFRATLHILRPSSPSAT